MCLYLVNLYFLTYSLCIWLAEVGLGVSHTRSASATGSISHYYLIDRLLDLSHLCTIPTLHTPSSSIVANLQLLQSPFSFDELSGR
jgi:hypothetical protein